MIATLSLPPVMKCWPKLSKPTPLTAVLCSLTVVRHFLFTKSHTLTVPIVSPEANLHSVEFNWPWNINEQMVVPCPLRECVTYPPSISQTVITPSEPPKANREDVESTEEIYTGDGILKVLVISSLSKSNIRNCWDCDKIANLDPSGVITRFVMVSPSPSILWRISLVSKLVITTSSFKGVAKISPSAEMVAEVPPT